MHEANYFNLLHVKSYELIDKLCHNYNKQLIYLLFWSIGSSCQNYVVNKRITS